MTTIDYSKLKILIADDFGNFRSTLNEMLSRLGARNIDMAANGREVIERCKNRQYDLILCDYDLGSGKTGQHVLEDLRFQSILTKQTLFIIVSADTSKDVVMAAYDSEPDDYLMKPLTVRILQTRLNRLLLQRQALSGVFDAIDSGRQERAVGLLMDLSISEGRYALAAQKLLGEMFILAGELAKAERLYTHALQSRQLDWARLGLARVKQLQGELDLAGEWLRKIVDDSPLYLPAYDVLAENWHKMSRPLDEQSTIQRSVEISPKSILRHKRLANVAELNGDFPTALVALRNTVKLGRLSCYASPEDTFNLARIAANSGDRDRRSGAILVEVVDALKAVRERFDLSKTQSVKAGFLEARALALTGQAELGRQKLEEANQWLVSMSNAPLDVSVEQVAALQALGDKNAAQERITELVALYRHDQSALEALDVVAAEPISERGRELIASVNREGIDLYNQDLFDQAITCFERVLDRFPNNVGVRLNVVQSLIGKLKAGQRDLDTVNRAREDLRFVADLLNPQDSHFPRYKRLKAMAAGYVANSQ